VVGLGNKKRKPEPNGKREFSTKVGKKKERIGTIRSFVRASSKKLGPSGEAQEKKRKPSTKRNTPNRKFQPIRNAHGLKGEAIPITKKGRTFHEKEKVPKAEKGIKSKGPSTNRQTKGGPESFRETNHFNKKRTENRRPRRGKRRKRRKKSNEAGKRKRGQAAAVSWKRTRTSILCTLRDNAHKRVQKGVTLAYYIARFGYTKGKKVEEKRKRGDRAGVDRPKS